MRAHASSARLVAETVRTTGSPTAKAPSPADRASSMGSPSAPAVGAISTAIAATRHPKSTSRRSRNSVLPMRATVSDEGPVAIRSGLRMRTPWYAGGRELCLVTRSLGRDWLATGASRQIPERVVQLDRMATAPLPVRRVRFEYPDDMDPMWSRLPEFAAAANAI